MEIRQLQYFLVLCKELHFSEAAFKIGISQPTLSQQIRVLEDELEVPLFDRMGKKIAKTEAGEVLESYALQVVQQLSNAKKAIGDLNNLHTGSLRIAVLPSDLDYRLTEILIDFRKDFPNTKVQVFPTIESLTRVLDNDVDIGIGLKTEVDSRIERIPFYTETYSLFVNETHEFAQKKSVISGELSEIPLVMYPQGKCGRDLIDKWCVKQGVTIDSVMETGSATSLFQLVREDIGSTIQPSQLIENFHSLGIRSIPIESAPTRELEIFYRNDRYLSKAAEAFIKLMIEKF
ncbi:LysR substrate-binding domain-containing protein [Psychrobacillus sp.]|uniref:LysR substrate-binding domain-containing protein n=1 Tax=Psychrobacillus sp. TaxID=1871623 RepID=UPI0028BE3096|nr:LysR substrate-binding domain-containing protein [Psychrobacillus sp.]